MPSTKKTLIGDGGEEYLEGVRIGEIRTARQVDRAYSMMYNSTKTLLNPKETINDPAAVARVLVTLFRYIAENQPRRARGTSRGTINQETVMKMNKVMRAALERLDMKYITKHYGSYCPIKHFIDIIESKNSPSRTWEVMTQKQYTDNISAYPVEVIALMRDIYERYLKTEIPKEVMDYFRIMDKEAPETATFGSKYGNSHHIVKAVLNLPEYDGSKLFNTDVVEWADGRKFVLCLRSVMSNAVKKCYEMSRWLDDVQYGKPESGKNFDGVAYYVKMNSSLGKMINYIYTDGVIISERSFSDAATHDGNPWHNLSETKSGEFYFLPKTATLNEHEARMRADRHKAVHSHHLFMYTTKHFKSVNALLQDEETFKDKIQNNQTSMLKIIRERCAEMAEREGKKFTATYIQTKLNKYVKQSITVFEDMLSLLVIENCAEKEYNIWNSIK